MTKKIKRDKAPMNNPVAKFAGKFNKSAVFRDRRAYSRKAKHNRQELFSISAV